MKIVRILDRIVDILSKAGLLCGGILLLVMAFNITYGVVARYVFNNPSVYAMELTKILMIPALVLAVAYVQRYNRHLQVDFLSARFPLKFRLILLDIVVPITGLFVGFILVWKGWESMTYSYSINETSYSSWAEPLWPVRLMIPIGYALLCLVMVAQLCKGVARLLEETRRTKEGPETIVKSEQV